MKNLKLLSVILFTLIYLLIACVLAVNKQNHEFMIYIGIVFLVLIVVARVHLKCGLTLPLLWCLSIWGLLHMAGGFMPVPEGLVSIGKTHVLYNVWIIDGKLKFDQIVHAYGFGITTWLIWQILQTIISAKVNLPKESIVPTVGLMVICIASGMGFGALNEVFEFMATIILPETNVGGYINTGWDLVSNLVGSIIAGVWIFFSSK